MNVKTCNGTAVLRVVAAARVPAMSLTATGGKTVPQPARDVSEACNNVQRRTAGGWLKCGPRKARHRWSSPLRAPLQSLSWCNFHSRAVTRNLDQRCALRVYVAIPRCGRTECGVTCSSAVDLRSHPGCVLTTPALLPPHCLLHTHGRHVACHIKQGGRSC